MWHFWLRGIPQGADQTFELKLWAVEKPGEHERVLVDDPLELADVDLEVSHERWQRDV